MPDQPKALVTAAVRGPGLELLHELADLTLDSWLDQPSLRIYNVEQLAERMAAEGASIAIVESDRCAGPLFELDLLAVCSCRGDPNNVDVEAATEAGVPVLRAPGRNADAVAELTVGLLFAATRASSPRTTTYGLARSTRTAPSPTNASARGSSPAGPPAWSGSEPSGARPSGGWPGSAWRSSPTTPTRTNRPSRWRSSSSARTSSRCTHRSPTRRRG